MSAGTSANVTTGKRAIDGGIYAAPIGTTLPTTATETLNSAFKNLGYVSEDGFKLSTALTSTKIKEWGGDTVYEEADQKDESAGVKYIEALNIEMLKTIYGPGNVTESQGAIHIASKAGGTKPMSYVVDIAQRGGKLRRIVLPNASITALGDIVFNGSEAVAYDVTLGLSLGANGTTHDEYISAGTT